MTIDQMNEIAEWLSPLDKYGITWEQADYDGKIYINMPSQIIALYFDYDDTGVMVENAAETWEPISSTSIWEQICLRNL